MARLSGLQQEVLSLYRRILREAMKKDRQGQQRNSEFSSSSPNTNSLGVSVSIEKNPFSFLSLRGAGDHHKTTTTTAFAVREFRKQALSVNRSDFKTIEYMIRKGDKQIKLLRMPGVTLVSGAHSP